MKKITILLLGFLLGIGINAHALPLWDDSPITIDGNTYTVIDRQGSGAYNSTYSGYTGDGWSGYYIGTILGNDKDQTLSDIISYYLGELYTVTDPDKVDVPDGATAGSLSDGDLIVTWDGDRMSGTWSTSSSEPAVAVEFYTVKGSTEFALYYIDPAMQDGFWTTAHLLNGGGQQPSISHLSATYTDVASVPEPATMLLLGSGLIGFAVFRKKFKK